MVEYTVDSKQAKTAVIKLTRLPVLVKSSLSVPMFINLRSAYSVKIYGWSG
jgi:hypothetical protein